MRMARVRYDREMCYYHLMNRVAEEAGFYPFGDAEKERLFQLSVQVSRSAFATSPLPVVFPCILRRDRPFEPHIVLPPQADRDLDHDVLLKEVSQHVPRNDMLRYQLQLHESQAETSPLSLKTPSRALRIPA